MPFIPELAAAIKNNEMAKCLKLIEKAASAGTLYATDADEKGNNYLYYAVLGDNDKIAPALIQLGINPNQPNKETPPDTPVKAALRLGKLKLYNIFRQNQKQDLSPEGAGVGLKLQKTINALGGKLLSKEDSDNLAGDLMLACRTPDDPQKRNLTFVSAYIAMKGDVNVALGTGNSAFSYAIGAKNGDIAKALVAAGFKQKTFEENDKKIKEKLETKHENGSVCSFHP